MFKELFAKLLIFPLMASSLAFGESLSSLYLNKAYWESFNWQKHNQSSVWNDPGFKPYRDSTDITNGKNYHHNQFLDIEGKPFHATLVRYTNKLSNENATILSPKDSSKGSCDKQLSTWNRSFGANNGLVDNTYYEIEGYGLYEKSWQWDVGQTRITMTCLSLGKPDEDYVSITYEAIEPSNKIEQPIHLNCPRKYQMVNDGSNGEWITLQPLTFTVIPSKMVITDTSLIRAGEVESFTDSAIRFLLKTKDLELRFDVSRVDGTLTGSAIDKKSRLTDARFQGTCETRVPSARKF